MDYTKTEVQEIAGIYHELAEIFLLGNKPNIEGATSLLKVATEIYSCRVSTENSKRLSEAILEGSGIIKIAIWGIANNLPG